MILKQGEISVAMAVAVVITNLLVQSLGQWHFASKCPEGSRIGAYLTTPAASGGRDTCWCWGRDPPQEVGGHFCGGAGLWQKLVAGTLGFARVSTYAAVHHSAQSGAHQHLAPS